jgi:hypothetical protein
MRRFGGHYLWPLEQPKNISCRWTFEQWGIVHDYVAGYITGFLFARAARWGIKHFCGACAWLAKKMDERKVINQGL